MKNAITTHVLDTTLGRPAAGVSVALFRENDEQVGCGETDADGRVMSGLIADDDFQPGVYRLQFQLRSYFKSSQREAFYPEVVIAFVVTEGQSHYHVPLLLSPFGYSTYRGS